MATPADKITSPTVEESPLAKVNVLAASLETRSLSGTPEKAAGSSVERMTETGRLKISWPPRAEACDGENAQEVSESLSPAPESSPVVRSVLAKWPPEGDALSPAPSPELSELSSLQRSSSLRERSRPFSISPSAATVTKDACFSKPEPVRIFRDGQEETSQSPDIEEIPLSDKICTSDFEGEELKEEVGNSGQEESPEFEEEEGPTSEEEELGRDSEELGTEQGDENELPSPESQPSPMDSIPPASPSPELQQNFTSQDVGFWEGEEAEEDQEDVSVEELIKRNRHYEEEEQDN